MSLVGEIASSAPVLDHQMSTFDATMELILLGKESAFVKMDDQFIGIVSLDNILEDYSDSKLVVLMEPLFSVKANENKLKVASLMLEKNVEHVAVTSQAGEFVGITSAKALREEP